MRWLARLKKIDAASISGATEPTKHLQKIGNRGFVGFVAPHIGLMQKSQSNYRATNDFSSTEPDASENLIKPKVATAANDPAADPNRWCWPRSQAMNTAEIDTFLARLARFTDKGLSLDEAEALADKLMTRDRELGDRWLCLECSHLAGRAGTWGCRNWQRAGVATQARDAQLLAALVTQPQRCYGFKDQNPQGGNP